MADYSVTASSVLASGTGTKVTGTAGATLTAGQSLYADASDSNKLKLADANASLATATLAGIALHGATSGQPITYCTADDDFTHGLSGVAAGDIIILSATAGALAPAADLATGMFPVVAMVAKSSTKAHFRITQGSVAK